MKAKSFFLFCLTGIILGMAACRPGEPATSGGETAVLPETTPAADNTVSEAAGPAGKLIFIQLGQTNGAKATTLVQYDLANSATTPLFTPPAGGLLLSADVAPDGSQAMLAYAPPPPEGQIQFGYTGLYRFPLNGAAAPQLLVEKRLAEEIFFHPVWAADGRVYYAHMGPEEATVPGGFFVVRLERLDVAAGETAVIVQDGIWPRVSSDGSRLTYAYSEPTSRGNELYVASPDGSDPLQLTTLDDFLAVDSPLFSPDGRTVYFSAVTEDTLVPQTSWFERLMGVRVALAHDIPSDWWRIPADGSGPAERMTTIREIGLYGDFSPDGRYFAFISAAGLYIMEPDGQNLNKVLETAVVGGALAWIP